MVEFNTGADADLNAAVKSRLDANADTNTLTDAERSKLTGVEAGSTANATDAQLRDRATHTGTQDATSVTGLSAVATSGGYGDLAGVPSTFPPDSHTHALAQITDAGTAAGAATGDFATAAQGQTADTALQPTDIASGTITPASGNLDLDNLGGAAVTFDSTTYTEVTAGSNVTFADDGDGTMTMNVSSGSATVGDGDYGDVTVSGGGATWDVDESGVTKHQAALTITESQISDLQSYLTSADVGTAAAADTGDFATAAQGTLAGTAVQPGDNVGDLANDAGYVPSDTSVVAGSSVEQITNMVKISQSDYDAIGSPDASTYYVIVG